MRNLKGQCIIETGFFALFLLQRLFIDFNDPLSLQNSFLNSKFDDDKEIKKILFQIQEQNENTKKFQINKRSIDKIMKEFSDNNNIQYKSLLKEAMYFFIFYSSRIEIFRSNQIEEIYYIKYPYTVDLEESVKDEFNRLVDRSTTHVKVVSLLKEFDMFWTTMKFKYILRTSFFGIISVFLTQEQNYKTLSFILAIFANLLVALAYGTKNPQSYNSRLNDVSLYWLSNDQVELLLALVGLPLLLIGFRFFILYLIRGSYFFHHKFWREHRKDVVVSQPISYFEYVYKLIQFLGMNIKIWYYLLFMLAASLGIFLHPFFYIFHSLELLNKFEDLRNFLKAITDPWKQLLYTFVLFLIIEYIFTIIGYMNFSEYIGENGEMCQSLWICFFTVFDMTKKFEGGVGTYMDEQGDTVFLTNRYRTIYDTAFNFALIVIMLNIVSGIIIDTFGQLRDGQKQKMLDKKKNCFICGLDK